MKFTQKAVTTPAEFFPGSFIFIWKNPEPYLSFDPNPEPDKTNTKR